MVRSQGNKQKEKPRKALFYLCLIPRWGRAKTDLAAWAFQQLATSKGHLKPQKQIPFHSKFPIATTTPGMTTHSTPRPSAHTLPQKANWSQPKIFYREEWSSYFLWSGSGSTALSRTLCLVKEHREANSSQELSSPEKGLSHKARKSTSDIIRKLNDSFFS